MPSGACSIALHNGNYPTTFHLLEMFLLKSKMLYDPAKESMADLRAMLPIEGCNVPGGLQRISDWDEPSSVPFWCGTPPHCLNVGLAYADSCVFIKHCRRDPRYDPNGAPGANGCRDPEDLVCVGSGAHPEGGYCLQTCWDGSRIPFLQACPSPPQPPAPRPPTPVRPAPPVTPPATPDPVPPPVQICSDGSIMTPSGCPQYCPDGSLMPPGGCLREREPKVRIRTLHRTCGGATWSEGQWEGYDSFIWLGPINDAIGDCGQP